MLPTDTGIAQIAVFQGRCGWHRIGRHFFQALTGQIGPLRITDQNFDTALQQPAQLERFQAILTHLMASISHSGRRVAQRDMVYRASGATHPNGWGATEGRSPRPRGGVTVLGRCTTSTCEPRLPKGPW